MQTLIDNIVIFIFVFSVLFLIREGFLLVARIIKNNSIPELPNVVRVIEPYQIGVWRQLGTALSVSYIITTIIFWF